MPNFHPDTGGRRWTLIQVASTVALRGGTGAAFRSMPLRFPAVLYGVCPALRVVPALGCSTKAQNKKLRGLFALSGSGSQELDGRALPMCSAPSALRVPGPSPCLCWLGACALCLAATLPEDVDHPESQEVFD